MATQQKEKIAVLGAGPSALVAAFRLTEEPDWREKYEITIYQQGWRVGGKCATGRDLTKHKRLYEHGIHGFLGCYFNALTVMQRAFRELERDPETHPLPDFPSAFHGMSGVIRYEMDDGKLKKWPIAVPTNKLHREDLDDADVKVLASIDVWAVNLARVGALALRKAYSKTFRHMATEVHVLKGGALPPDAPHPMKFDPAKGLLDTRIKDGKREINEQFAAAIAAVEALLPPEMKEVADIRKPKFRLKTAELEAMMAAVAALYRRLGKRFGHIVEARGGDSEAERDRIRRAGLLLDFIASIFTGVLKDKVHLKGFASIDHWDHVDWLRKQGEASDATIASPLTSSTPNITYQYPKGDSIRPAVMAAGAYLHWTMMTFTYMGEFIQLFEAGSGETLIAPLYDALKKKGVKFAFFHTVTDIRADDANLISEVDVDIQATVTEGPYSYDPYIPIKKRKWGEPLLCWPDRPLYDQLAEGEALKSSGADLESFWCGWAPVGRKTLTRGKDFDRVILGVSVGGVKFLTKDLAKRNRRWKRMLDNAVTVSTQAMQIWLNKTPWDLGWNGYTNEYDDYLLSANFMTQPNGQGDFTKYIKYEDWPKGHEPKSLLLLCGTLPFYHEIDGTEGEDFPRRIAEQVKHQSIQFLQATGGFMLEDATVATTQKYGDPFSFDFDLLHPVEPEEEGKEKQGAQRFDDQYWRVNINPSDNYVSTPPDSTKHRLPADDTGFANLSIAGDWTENGLNVGSMEGSVRSGLLAAEAVIGVPRSKSGVIGLDPTVKMAAGGGPRTPGGKTPATGSGARMPGGRTAPRT